jgi:hypothetical protein
MKNRRTTHPPTRRARRPRVGRRTALVLALSGATLAAACDGGKSTSGAIPKPDSSTTIVGNGGGASDGTTTTTTPSGSTTTGGSSTTTGLATSTTVASGSTTTAGTPSTTKAPSTSTTSAGPGTTAPATTTPRITTPPTTTPPTTTPPRATTGCTFAKADQPVSVAFCDTFDAPAGNSASRAGDLNPVIWGVSRTNTLVNFGQGDYNLWNAATLKGCGANQTVVAPRDVRICNGRLVEAVSDGGGQATLAMYPKQPFDIAGGRTGTVVFDVSADSQGPHAAWPEFWWTDQPVPAPHAHQASQMPYARNSFGFTLTLQCAGDEVGVETMSVTRSYSAAEVPFTSTGCVKKGSINGALNHFEVRISQSRVEVWATDPGSTDIKMIAVATNPNITMTRGLVWLEDVHYNGCKFDTQCDHGFAWDNLGFDGPTPYRDLSFDAPDANRSEGGGQYTLGYNVESSPVALTINGVYWTQPPTGAIVTFNWFPYDPIVPSVRINGGAWHDTAWPFDPETYGWRTIAVSIPVAEVQAGTNTIEFKVGSGDEAVVSNVNVILIAGSPVPR